MREREREISYEKERETVWDSERTAVVSIGQAIRDPTGSGDVVLEEGSLFSSIEASWSRLWTGAPDQ